MPAIAICCTGGTVVLSGSGELGLDCVDEMTQALNIALIKRKPVTVDLCLVSWMDEAILSCLHVLGRAFARRGRRLVVRVVRNTQPEGLLNRAGLSQWMTLVSVDSGPNVLPLGTQSNRQTEEVSK